MFRNFKFYTIYKQHSLMFLNLISTKYEKDLTDDKLLVYSICFKNKQTIIAFIGCYVFYFLPH